MYFDLWDILYRLLYYVGCAIAALSMIFLASLVWHFGEICLRGWFW